MKKIILFTLMPAILFSCTSADKQKDTTGITSTDTPGPDFKTLDTAIYFAGIWVNEKYINDIKRTTSPRESQDINESCIIIPDRTLKVTRMIAGFHEGAADWVIVKNKNKYQFYDNKFITLIRNIDPVSSNRIKIGGSWFIKIRQGDENKPDLNILEDILFSGEYKSVSGKNVSFTVDGRVTGLDSFNYYNAVIDYADMASNVNQVELGGTKKNLRSFGFKFNKDSLLIYKLRCKDLSDNETQCADVEFDKLIYKLLRKN